MTARLACEMDCAAMAHCSPLRNYSAVVGRNLFRCKRVPPSVSVPGVMHETLRTWCTWVLSWSAACYFVSAEVCRCPGICTRVCLHPMHIRAWPCLRRHLCGSTPTQMRNHEDVCGETCMWSSVVPELLTILSRDGTCRQKSSGS